AEVLQDSDVSFSELEGAALVLVSCIEDALAVEGEATYRGDSFAFDFHDPTGRMNEKMERFGSDVERCEAEIDEIQLAWANQQADGHERDPYEAVVDCLRNSGISIEDATPAALGRASATNPDEYQKCLSAAFPGIDE
ncbi:MAG: hypothetical protein KDB69_03170, partial [Acidimicrobiia bacterium]|nr:hypothetical protein [Acidimicrobiia bacterium]